MCVFMYNIMYEWMHMCRCVCTCVRHNDTIKVHPKYLVTGEVLERETNGLTMNEHPLMSTLLKTLEIEVG